MMIKKFRTQSGARYVIEDNCITRMSELPMVGVDGKDLPASDTIQVPIEDIIQLQVGDVAVILTIKGPIRTTPVTEIEETDD